MANAPSDHAHHPHHAQLIDEHGQWRFTNQLIHSVSPYLLQHAHNPVDWYPWSDEALALAHKQAKPIFLSIGYSTCYWCHVMERQVFEDPQIASLMNRYFINIKVDREQRPDLDDLYMTATQLLTQHGGWPMSVFLTPSGAEGSHDMGLKPFYAGTYFPPEPTHGLPGFPQLIEQIHNAWQSRQQEVLEQANQIADAVEQVFTYGSSDTSSTPAVVNLAHTEQAVQQLARMVDRQHGGFGSQPKFPTPVYLRLLMADDSHKSAKQHCDMVAFTLRRMAFGGMYDQIGGGFHRYSVDAQWLVPHFEKMLYDNAQLMTLYANAQQTCPAEDDPNLYRDVSCHIADYILREMVDATGAFWSAQDAEVDAREGANYVWTSREVDEAIRDTEEAKLAKEYYGLDLGPNFRDPHDPQAKPCNVLFVPVPTGEFAKSHGMSLEQWLERLQEIDAKLLAARDQRKQPATDDKVLVEWNGMMIGALARTGKFFDQPNYTQAAQRAAETILQRMRSADGELYRTMRNGEPQIPAFLSDYAWMIHGLLELHLATNDPRWVETAWELLGHVMRIFASPSGGYFDTREGSKDLFIRTQSVQDGAVPSGNSVMVNNLLTLYEQTGNRVFFDQATRDLQGHAKRLEQQGANMSHMHEAVLRWHTLQSRAGMTKSLPVPVSMRVEKQQAETSGHTLSVAITIAEGYHIASSSEAYTNSVQPTQLYILELEDEKQVIKYPLTQTITSPLEDGEMQGYQGEIIIQVIVSTTQQNITLQLQCQPCSNRECLQPMMLELPVTLMQHL